MTNEVGTKSRYPFGGMREEKTSAAAMQGECRRTF